MALGHMPLAFSSGEFSDCAIECDGQIFNVHKVVVCPQSSVLRSAFVKTHEAIKMEPYKIEAFSADVVQTMLCFMYGAKEVWHQKATDTVTDDGEAASDNTTISKLSTLMELGVAAHFFKVESFRDAVNHEIETLLRQKWCARIFGVAVGIVAKSEVDKSLQKLMCRIAADHVQELVEESVDLGDLMKLDGAAMEFMSACASHFEKTIQLKTKTDLLEAKEVALAKALKDKNEIIASMEKSIELLNNDDECPYCQDDYGWYIETYNFKTYTVLCRGCDRPKNAA